MKIDTIKDLKKVIQLCRETGVDIIKVDGIELVLGSSPTPRPVKAHNSSTETFSSNIGPNTPIETPDSPTEEQLLFYSSQTSPGEI